jgi:prolyl-tRNA synthetase
MRLSQLFTKTLKNAPAEETSMNAQLLIRGGFVHKIMAGVYAYLPLGYLVLERINAIIREEMNAIGAQELTMSVLQNKETWTASGRWDSAKEVMYQFEDAAGHETGLGWTHEEPLTEVARHHISSYKDLPKAVYQIQTKFRNEPRAKSGILRGREFVMKDLYSFHADEASLDEYYEKVAGAYARAYERVGLKALRTKASGGLFSKYSDEYQVIADIGEDTVYYTDDGRAWNAQVAADMNIAEGGEIKKGSAVEVGNIFKLGTKFSEAFGLNYTDEKGQKHPVIMASYGWGPSRIMGTIVELNHDDAGIIWPSSIAPFTTHLVSLGQDARCDDVYDQLTAQGITALYDDRIDRSAGEKFADADLIGCPVRLTIGGKTPAGQVEFKRRAGGDSRMVAEADIAAELKE